MKQAGMAVFIADKPSIARGAMEIPLSGGPTQPTSASIGVHPRLKENRSLAQA
tara:strand:- start:72 stop:230 length:159 start_codon:yes stop_codon:yes gene_type:complete